MGLVLAALSSALVPLSPLPALPALEAQEARYEGSLAAATIGGVVGGVAGFFAGALVGSSADCSELCADIILGALIGETVGVALGAHVLDDARGSLGADLLVSTGVMVAGLGLASLDSGDEFLYAAMIGQVIAVAITEVRTSPRIEATTAPRRTPEGLALDVGVRIR